MALQNSSMGEGIQQKEYIVGIGASAGGLEAIHELFDNMPDDTNFSFVIVQHLSPDYKSLMPELLAKHTTMQILEAKEGMLVKPNTIYVIPSKKIMRLSNGFLKLTEKAKDHLPNTAIDIFFTSLAEANGNKAIGIILSGTGTDGTKGIAAIKNNGGIVIVQDPLSAKFDGMPNSAIATGHADLILPPELMAGELGEYLVEAPFLKAYNEINSRDEHIITEILEIIKKDTSHNFTQYKRPTINRRLLKRMTQVGIKTLPDYRQLLLNDVEEIKKLCKEFLIGVTKFFRDEEAFAEIQNHIIPAIVKAQKENETIKIWVVACSTGEEAYSIAILCHEYMEKHNRADLSIKIFATDIDKAALEDASKGIYPKTIAIDVSAERLEKYFTHEGGERYKVSATIRRMVVFAPHDILSDPPFSKLQFISCRNMLIYMNPDLQKKVLKVFHFALYTGGYLMLGPSENIGVLKDYMNEVNKKWKVFKTLERGRIDDSNLFFSPLEGRTPTANSKKMKNALHYLPDIFSETVMEEYNFANIIIDKENEIKQATGNFKNYLQFPDKNLNFNLLKLVNTDLSIALSTAIRKAAKDNEKVSIRNVKVHDASKNLKLVNIVVKPYLNQADYLQPFLSIAISEQETLQKPKVVTQNGSSNSFDLAERIQEVEEELQETKENLQAVVEELETSNEELQSSNEEMVSANEELQSTNEELQSLNEELHTVNAEHQLKIKELIELNDDMNNYFQNTEIGQLLVDANLIIRKFTPFTKKQINLRDADIGRALSDLSYNFKDANLVEDIHEVMKHSVKLEKEILLQDGKIYQMRISPYIRQDKSMDGAVITFVDISKLKELNSMIEGVFNSSISGIMALRAIRDEQNNIVDFEWLAANHAAEKLIGAQGKHLTGKRLLQEFPSLDRSVYEKYKEVIDTGGNLLIEYEQKSENKFYQIIGVRMHDGIVITFADITEQKQSLNMLAKGYDELQLTSNQLRSSNSELERSNYDLMQFASVASHDLKEPLRKIQTYGNLLFSKISTQLKDNELKYLDKIVKSSQRMQILIDDVLTFSKLSNKNNYFMNTDINHVISRIVEDLEITIKEKEVTVEVNELPEIEAIPGQMNQLFQNLISNALKFNNSERPVITISNFEITAEVAQELGLHNNEYVGINVADNGIGFEEKYKDKIFKIFQRLHNQTDYQGTGIGLAICKKIVENHNGFITVESEISKGSEFKIMLPRKQPLLLKDNLPDADMYD